MRATLETNAPAVRLAAVKVGRSDPILVGVFAFSVNVIGAGRPSLWLDEAATISGATRTVPQMFALLGNVDAVHGLYYLLMHAWFAIFPVTEFWARLPSALLVGAAAAGLVVLGRQLSTRSLAVAAGVVFTVLPRTTWAGIEARPYAMSMCAAVWLTVLLVAAVRRDATWIWVAYALGLVVATVGNVFVAFVVAAHAVVVWGSRREVMAWAGSLAGAMVLAAPFLIAIKAQQSQVDWIWPVGPGTIGQLLGDQYFPAVYSDSARATGLVAHQLTSAEISAAIHAWLLVAPFIAAVLIVVVSAVRMSRHATGDGTRPTEHLLTWAAVAWIATPTAVLICYSLVGKPVYQPHYLSFTAPGLALLLGRCVVIVAGQPRRIAVILAAVVAAAIPNYVAQRGPYAKIGSDYSQVADVIASHASANDCLNVDDTAPQDLIVAFKATRPHAYAALRDDGLDRSAVDRGALFESRRPITAWADELRTCPGLWTVTARDPDLAAHEEVPNVTPNSRLRGTAAQRVPAEMGFRAVERWQFNLTQVVKLLPPSG